MNKNYYSKKLKNAAILCTLLFFLTTLGLQAQTIRYVKQGGTGNGATWATASGNLQNTINASSANDEVWVAAGTYLPTATAGGYTSRDKAFLLKNDVKLYGGFPATGIPTWADRNWQTNITLLSGNLGSTASITDNSYHVVLAVGTETSSISANTVLNGFTVAGGNANGSDPVYINGMIISRQAAGGILNHYSNATMENLVVRNNSTNGFASAIRNYYSSPYMANIIVSGNSTYSGTIQNDHSSPTFINMVITGNYASTNIAGLHNWYNSSPLLINLTISGNNGNVDQAGSAFTNSAYCHPTLYNCLIAGNSSGAYGGDFTNSLTYENCILQDITDGTNGNLNGDIDVLFVDAPSYTTAPFIGGDYNLLACSPVINLGSNSYVPFTITTDVAGNPRIHNNTIDLGAYEFQGVTFTPSAPTAPPTQTLDGGATVADLVATGQDTKWYLTATGGEQLTPATLLVQGTTYYVSQTLDGCESTRVPVQVTLTYYYIRYVKAGATGNGLSWDDASGNLQAMIDVPYAQQVWVAAGTYMPTLIPGNGVSNRDKVFMLKDNVKIYGGFPATGNPVFADRDWQANPTLLSGDLGTVGSTSDNAYHVVLALAKESQPLSNETILDGFTIANSYGISSTNENQIIISGQYISRNAGGGLYVTNYTYAQFSNLSFVNNNSNTGGGIYTENYTFPVFNNLTLNNNIAGAYGGAIAVQGSPVFTNLTVQDNHSLGYGGGIYCAGNGDGIIFNNANIINNTSVSNGGGIYSDGGTMAFNNSRIRGNSAGNDGGGFHTSGCSITLFNTAITGNLATGQSGGMFNAAGYLNLTNVTIAGNNIIMGNLGVPNAGGMYNLACQFTLTNSVIYGNRGNVNNFSTTFEYFNSLVQGSNDTTNGNLSGSINPLFTDLPYYENAPFTTGDYSLQSNSPLINAGSNALYTAAGGNTENGLDLEGNTRIYDFEDGGTIDIGAFEYQGAPACAFTTIWNGTTWSNGEPQNDNYSAIIAGNYTSAGDITACSLYIYDGDVTVQTGDTFTIKGGITVDNANATLTVQDNAALVQVNQTPNTGTIAFHKQANALYNNQFTLWSSPVSGQNLHDFSPLTPNGSYYLYSTESTISDYYNVDPVTQNFLPATGYRIGMPQSVSGTNAAAYAAGSYAFNYNGVFTGVPNNGAINAPLNTTGNLYSAIGNPYPSPINVADFFEAGNGILDPASSIYLWSQGNTATGYAMLSSTTFITNNPDANSQPAYSGNPAEWTIAPGQGFLIQSADQMASFPFANNMRRGANTAQPFFKTTDAYPLSRLWLDLKAANGAFQQISVAYKDGATLDIDAGMEGKLFATPQAMELYSFAQNIHLAIQTRPVFTATDVVALGFKAITAGQHTLSLNHFDGVFEDDQDIYLRDLAQNGQITNLKENNYTFTTDAGTFEARFELLYTLPLGIKDVFASNTIIVYKNNQVLHIDAGLATISSVVLYDLSGRKVLSQENINNTKAAITGLTVKDQLLFAEINTNYGRVIKKVLY